MGTTQAKAVLLRHADGGREENSLLWSLCPYTGNERRHLLEVLRALYAVAPELSDHLQVDRELVHVIWDLCRTARNWTRGPHDPNFHGPKFVPPAAKKELEAWVDEFEAIALHLLRGLPAALAFGGMPDFITEYQLGGEAAFLAPLLAEQLQANQRDDPTGENSDDEHPVRICVALESMGSSAVPAIPILAAVRETSGHARLREAAARALAAISGTTPTTR